uniref:Uncharacterized protein n=1 Tax=Oryza rufipogon TaxID=4529 RepID=A0A0E0N1P5_ORYRU
MTVKARVTSSCANVEASQLTSRTLLTLRLADRTKPDDEPHNANELLLPDKILLVVTIVHIVASSVAHRMDVCARRVGNSESGCYINLK